MINNVIRVYMPGSNGAAQYIPCDTLPMITLRDEYLNNI